MTTFYSYWGSSIHGVEIAWTADPSADTLELTFEYTAYYYWRMPFFYDGSDADDLALATHVGLTFGEAHGLTTANTEFD